MMSSLARHASHGASALGRVLSWPSRIGAQRKAMTELARMSDYELRDIGLVRQDIVHASMLRSDADPLSERRAARERPAPRRRDVAA